MSRYGQGNARAIARIRRENRRIATHVRETDERDIGARDDLALVFGFGDPRGMVSSWRSLAVRRLTR